MQRCVSRIQEAQPRLLRLINETTVLSLSTLRPRRRLLLGILVKKVEMMRKEGRRRVRTQRAEKWIGRGLAGDLGIEGGIREAGRTVDEVEEAELRWVQVLLSWERDLMWWSTSESYRASSKVWDPVGDQRGLQNLAQQFEEVMSHDYIWICLLLKTAPKKHNKDAKRIGTQWEE